MSRKRLGYASWWAWVYCMIPPKGFLRQKHCSNILILWLVQVFVVPSKRQSFRKPPEAITHVSYFYQYTKFLLILHRGDIRPYPLERVSPHLLFGLYFIWGIIAQRPSWLWFAAAYRLWSLSPNSSSIVAVWAPASYPLVNLSRATESEVFRREFLSMTITRLYLLNSINRSLRILEWYTRLSLTAVWFGPVMIVRQLWIRAIVIRGPQPTVPKCQAGNLLTRMTWSEFNNAFWWVCSIKAFLCVPCRVASSHLLKPSVTRSENNIKFHWNMTMMKGQTIILLAAGESWSLIFHGRFLLALEIRGEGMEGKGGRRVRVKERWKVEGERWCKAMY